jgi:biotin operon repressor
VLTEKQQAKIAICNQYLTNPRYTLDSLAAKLSISRTTVAAAIKWGKQRGYFITDNSEKLRRNIIDIQSTLEILEKEYAAVWKEDQRRRRAEHKRNIELKRQGESPKNIHFSLTRTLTGLSKRILEYKTRIMELEGLYGRLHEGLMPTDSKLSDPLVQMLIQVTGPVYNIKISGNGKNGTNGTNGNGKKDFSANSK